MPPPSFISSALPHARRGHHSRDAPLCTLPSVSDLTSLGVLTLRPRPADYKVPAPSALTQVEPELIALVGVSHHASSRNGSATHATAAITRLRPDAVVVELCRVRAPLLNAAPAASSLPAWARVAARLGLPGLGVAGRGGDGGGGGEAVATAVAAGAEFRAAARAAEQVGATVVLGDRPVQRTLRRAWGSLRAGERVAVAAGVARMAVTGGGGAVEDVADKALREAVLSGVDVDGVVQRYVTALGERFPGLRRTLVEERDVCLAWALKRSRAVSGCKCVVGVVGCAHVQGVLRALDEDDRRRSAGEVPLLRFRDLAS